MSAVEGWETKTLLEISEITMGQSPDSKYYTEEEQGLPFIQGCAEFTSRFPNPKLHCTQIKKVAKTGSILFSVRAPVGRINIADQPYIIGRGLAAIFAKGINQELLERCIDYQEPFFRVASQGSTFEAINTTELSKWSISFPSNPVEQTKIAEILSCIDTAIEQTEAIIAKQQRIKTGLMQDLLSKGIDEHGNIRSEHTHTFKDSPLGRIPEEWKSITLGEIIAKFGGKIQTGPFGSQLHAYEYIPEGVPVIMPQDITDTDISLLNIARVSENKVNELARHKVKTGDLIFARRGELSRCVFIESHQENWLCGTGCLLLRPPKTRLSSRWMAEIYKYHSSQSQIDIQAVGSTMPNLNTGILSYLIIPFPSFEEQKQIENKMLACENEQTALSNQLKKFQRTKTALMQDLLSGNVRVNQLIQ